MSAVQRYSDEELVICLRFAARDIGGVLSSEAFTDYGRRRTMPDGRPWPTHQTLQLRWGSWHDALVAAGLPANPRSSIAGNRLFTEEACLDAVRGLMVQLGHAPSVGEYDRYARASHGGLPSASTIRKQVGKWSDVKARL